MTIVFKMCILCVCLCACVFVCVCVCFSIARHRDSAWVRACKCARLRVCSCECAYVCVYEIGPGMFPIHSDIISDLKQAFLRTFGKHAVDGRTDGRM